MIISLIAYGCATSPPVIETQKVEVPVEVCHLPPLPAKPDLPLSQINEQTKPDDVMKLYIESILQLEGYIDQLRTLFVTNSK
jgi:hypothetical protein